MRKQNNGEKRGSGCGKERKRGKNKKKGISGKKKERKESENYKTENGRKLVMEDERKERRKDKEKNLAV